MTSASDRVDEIIGSVEFGNATHPYNSTVADMVDLRTLIASEIRKAQADALRAAADELRTWWLEMAGDEAAANDCQECGIHLDSAARRLLTYAGEIGRGS